MIWKAPHISKIYEALTVIADGRIEFTSEHSAKCFSSSRNKFYTLSFDLERNQIMSNDNSAFYTDSLSYPMIAVLMLKGQISYAVDLLTVLRGIIWKDIMQKFKNDYSQGVEFILTKLAAEGNDVNKIRIEIAKIYAEVLKLKFQNLGSKIKPPVAY